VLLASIAQAAQDGFARPDIDWHALAPELVLTGVLCLVLVADLLLPEDRRGLLPSLAGLGLLGALVPVLTLAVDGADRTMFGGAYAVDNFALVTKALFLVAGYVTVLLSTNYIAEGDYAEGEYYFLLLSSILGMTVMASARDLITIFVALEMLSVPAYLLAGWRKRDRKGNEAGVKYYLMGVFATGVLLYGMSLLYGVAGTTELAGIGEALATGESVPIITMAVVFVIAGFAFKVSAVPFHTWAPDTYEGAPTPITAFLSVLSKAAGFVALLQLVVIGFAEQTDVVRPLMWVLAAGSMTIGNVVALRQTNLVRMLAYSGISQAGFILAPMAVVGQTSGLTVSTVVTYLLIYAAMNLGAFTVVMAVARKTGSAEISTFGGLYNYAPSLAVLMTIFLFSLAGIPPLGGWLAKFVAFRAVVEAETAWAYALAVVMAVNSVIALAY
jgi:NADH-quinone oxidoreductase subunit N